MDEQLDEQFNQPFNQRLVTDFILHLQNIEGLAENTCQSYQTDLLIFVEHIHTTWGQSLLNIDESHLHHYLAKRVSEGISTTTNARIQSSLKRFFRYLVNEKHIEDNPTERIRRPKMAKKSQNLYLNKRSKPCSTPLIPQHYWACEIKLCWKFYMPQACGFPSW